MSGSVDAVSVSSLIDLPLFIDTQSSLGRIRTNVTVKRQGGKPRLRRIGTGGIQIQRQIEALLLMPKSIRGETQLIGGQPVVLEGRYVLRRVEVTAVRLAAGDAVLKLGGIDCNNDSGTHQIDFPSRVQELHHLYANADELPARIGNALRRHQAEIVASSTIGSSTERIVAEIIAATDEAAEESDTVLIKGEDPVPLLLDLLRSRPLVETPPLSEIDAADVQIRRRVADRWRVQKDRGPASYQFRRDVRSAYRSTCLFCGLRLVADDVRIPGVDAAHILPWASYDADEVRNGLCLCKQHHWAFDQYLLALKPDPTQRYVIEVSDLALHAFQGEPLVLAALASVSGPVVASRLPHDRNDWPHPQFLRQLYEDVGLGP